MMMMQRMNTLEHLIHSEEYHPDRIKERTYTKPITTHNRSFWELFLRDALFDEWIDGLEKLYDLDPSLLDSVLTECGIALSIRRTKTTEWILSKRPTFLRDMQRANLMYQALSKRNSEMVQRLYCTDPQLLTNVVHMDNHRTTVLIRDLGCDTSFECLELLWWIYSKDPTLIEPFASDGNTFHLILTRQVPPTRDLINKLSTSQRLLRWIRSR